MKWPGTMEQVAVKHIRWVGKSQMNWVYMICQVMFMNGVVIGMKKAITVAAQVIILKGQIAAVPVFCAAAVGTAVPRTVGYRSAAAATLTMGSAALAFALSSFPVQNRTLKS